MLYSFQADDGEMMDLDYPVGKAPKLGRAVRRKGKLFRRVYDIAPPICNELIMGRKPSRSHQLPRYYGYLDHGAVWRRKLNAMGLPDSKETRKYCREQGLAPRSKDFLEEGRRNAEKAKKLDRFDKDGRPMAGTMKTVKEHIGRGKDLGDAIAWD